jgi:hypothetical protein
MANKKQYYFFVLFLQIVLLQTTGCKKEYSCEDGCKVVIQRDSVIIPPISSTFPGCSSCKVADELLLSKWNFKTGNTFVCGSVDNAGFIGEGKAFTFFGPSACSIDTGIVFTVYLSARLDHDIYNETVNNVAYYYYDHHAARDIFISLSPKPFSVNIQSFIFSTRIMTGSFRGTVFKPNGDTAVISDGKFKIKLK